MKISTIENFKAFRNVEIAVNDSFNIIIGENKIGKSTVFEAIHLWMLGFKSLIKANGKQFYGKSTLRYIAFDQLYFLRLASIDDVFNTTNEGATITLDL